MLPVLVALAPHPAAISDLSQRIAMRLNSFNLQKKFSIRCRHLYISLSILRAWARVLRDDDLGTAFVERCDDKVAVECFVAEQRTKIDLSLS
jgi:hypothetical protein